MTARYTWSSRWRTLVSELEKHAAPELTLRQIAERALIKRRANRALSTQLGLVASGFLPLRVSPMVPYTLDSLTVPRITDSVVTMLRRVDDVHRPCPLRRGMWWDPQHRWSKMVVQPWFGSVVVRVDDIDPLFIFFEDVEEVDVRTTTEGVVYAVAPLGSMPGAVGD